MLVPKLATTLRSYDRRHFVHDVIAGVIVGVVAIPLAIAFGIASGVTPDKGLWTAIIAGFLISVLGGSRVQIGGPTGAFVVIVFGIIQKYGIDGLTVATLMAGVLLIAMGLAQLGDLIKFVPHPVVTGFTSAIGVTILVQQLDSAFGLASQKYPAPPIERLVAYWHNASSMNPFAVALCAATLAILLAWPKVSVRVPAPFVALIATTLAAKLLDLPITTVGDRFGELSSGFPTFVVPHVGLSDLRELVLPACTIAGLGAIESLLSAVVADGMIGGRHRPNVELVAQGVANVVTPLFGGIPATGAIARTATNVKSGGRTPVAGITHALTVLAITLVFGKWAQLIPLATLAGILLLVSYRMIEWRVFRAELRASRSDAAVLVTVFTLTLLVDLTVGIGVGVVLASLLFVRRMASMTEIRPLTSMSDAEGDEDMLPGDAIPPGVEVYEIAGPFFFGAADQFKDTLAAISQKPKVLIVRMRTVPFIDSTGLHVLRDLIRRTQGDGTRVIIAEMQEQPLRALQRGGVVELVGTDYVVGSLDLALAIAARIVSHGRLTPTVTHVVHEGDR
jgi:SulP family sulfate permease